MKHDFQIIRPRTLTKTFICVSHKATVSRKDIMVSDISIMVEELNPD